MGYVGFLKANNLKDTEDNYRAFKEQTDEAYNALSDADKVRYINATYIYRFAAEGKSEDDE